MAKEPIDRENVRASEILDHKDFRILDQFELLVGEHAALAWLNDAMTEAGYVDQERAA